MPSRFNATSFDTLRSWNGSQDRAFEELSYQLLKSEVPAGTSAVRTGNPDGGVEWYAQLPDGTQEGWQAKHYHEFDSLLSSMTRSLKTALVERPTLRKMTFVISSNLSESTRQRQVLSQRQKYDAKVASWKKNIPGASLVAFGPLIQGSDLLDRLADPAHAGRRWFWWDSLVLGEQWLKDRLAIQIDVAEDRYRPELQVDLPIQEDLEALGFSKSAIDQYEQMRHSVVSKCRKVHINPSGTADLKALHEAVEKAAKAVNEAGSISEIAPTSIGGIADRLQGRLTTFVDACHKAEFAERRLYSDWRDKRERDPKKCGPEPPQEAMSHRVSEASEAASNLSRWLDSPAGTAFRKRFYFLRGIAGSGKTHLFLDSVSRAIEDDRPAIVLFGGAFGSGDIWVSICDQLGLEPVGANTLLGAMDAAAEAAGVEGRRFVIHIDALNDTIPADFWHTKLPALRAAVNRWPHVALAVSCRDTYLNVVASDAERSKYVERSHPGFAGRETEAAQKYFAHHHLMTPQIPLLLPEFSVPLFLQMYCESLEASGGSQSAVGHESRIQIFELYLRQKIKKVARKLAPPGGTDFELEQIEKQIDDVVNALLDEFARTGRESAPLAVAQSIVTAVEGQTLQPLALIGALQSEGIFTKEQMYFDVGGYQDGFRIVFQAFADFLVLKRRIEITEDPLTDPVFKAWLMESASYGVSESAAVVLPEQFQVELPDFLGLDRKALVRPPMGDDEAWNRHLKAEQIFRSLVETLPYRADNAVTERTIDLLNDSMWLLDQTEIYRTIFLIAPHIGNRLNGNTLHAHLSRMKMPRRDASFGIAMYHEIFDEASPVATLARWASAGPYPTYDPEVIELACIPLIWLLSSPNRFMRDWITKSLVQLLWGHLDVTVSLLNRFWSVDDPYVVQRVVAIAYGAFLRTDCPTDENARALAVRVRKLVFTKPIVADELLLDAGRGIVELAVLRGLLPKTALRNIQRPYGLAPPSAPPSKDSIEAKYGFKDGQPDNESYSSIYFSLMSMGDFARYVVEAGLRHFSRYRNGQNLHNDEAETETDQVARWVRFCRSLGKAKSEELAKILSEDREPTNPLRDDLDKYVERLTNRQRKLWDRIWERPRFRPRDDEYPADRATRWIFRRTLSLGWVPKLFGVEDRHKGYGGGREEHKSERWGKKYQWMAYHELLARVADNYQSLKRFDDEEPYEGLYQLTADREIDPSLPPIPYREFNDKRGEGVPTWPASSVALAEWPPVPLNFSQYGSSIDKFLDDTASEATLDKITSLVDADGTNWILLNGLIRQGDPHADKYWLGLQQVVMVDSWFAPKDEGARLLSRLAGARKDDRFGLLEIHGHTDCCYFGEVGLTPERHCYYIHRDFKDVEIGGDEYKMVSPIETYQWEGSLLDCSIGESASATAPSTFIRTREVLTVDDSGPSWRDQAGHLVFANIDQSSNRGSSFVVRADWLKRFLNENELELMYASWHERMFIREGGGGQLPSEEIYQAGRINKNLKISTSSVIRERR
ncbi:MAG TPA: hypothetical protein VGG38_14075 [Acidimicrobiales bacterium]|jgi:hypothetical protein